jgi:RNA polymerase sigma factor (sigma-70 family)
MTSARTGPPELTTGALLSGTGVADLFRASYPGMVRLAGLLGADDPEDIAQEAFARLMQKAPPPDDPAPYLRTIVCNLTRNRHRHLRMARAKQGTGGSLAAQVAVPSSEQTAILREDHAEVIAALATLPPRRREAIVLRYWLDLSEREIAQTMGVPRGTVKSHVSRGLAALARALEVTA